MDIYEMTCVPYHSPKWYEMTADGWVTDRVSDNGLATMIRKV